MVDIKYSAFTLKTPPVSGDFVVGLDPTAVSDDDKNVRIPVIDFALLTISNTYTAGSRQNFVGLLAGTAGLNVGGIAGNPTTQVNGDIWINTSTNQIFGRVNGVNVDLGGSGDMVLADVQTVTGAKTFNDTKFLLRNVANSFNGSFVNTNTADRIYTLPDETGVISLIGRTETLVGKTLTTPTIVATGFTNMQHTHQAANTGGTLLSTAALSDTANIAYLNTVNAYIAGNKQSFLADATTAGLNINNQVPSTTTGGDIWRAIDALTYRNNADSGDLIIATLTDISGKFDTAGTGLTSSGTTVNVIGTASRITANANDIDIASNYVGQTSITTLGTIAAGTWQGTTIAVNQGGTGVTTSTGTGNAVLSSSPTIVTPTISSTGWTNANHAHIAANSGGQLVATTALTATGTKDSTTFLRGDDTWAVPPNTITSLIIPASGEDETLVVGTGKVTFRMPYAFTVTGVRASVLSAPTGSVLTIDINENGTTILSTKITIDATEKTSTTAATPPVISDSSLADDAEITIDIDTIGSTLAGDGLKVYLIGTVT